MRLAPALAIALLTTLMSGEALASAPWSITNRGAAGSPATAAQAAPTNAATSGTTTRVRCIEASLAGSAAGTDQLVVRDGATGAGTIIWQSDLSVAANGDATRTWCDLDLRATPGNSLTVEFVAGVASDREDVNAQGDFVQQGFAAFANAQ